MVRAIGWASRRWFSLVIAAWLVASAIAIWLRWQNIYFFALSDTDDNMRIMQVRAWLDGQGWYDLRQYRMNPPDGANIHWSRVVDLPIAGLRLLFGLFTDGPSAERAAVGIAPLLPLAVALTGLALTARRLLGAPAFLVAVPLFFFGVTALAQFLPTRIDHHGWQLAMLSVAVAGLVDRTRVRGGITAGLATAGSLSIGLEFLPYLAAIGGFVALFWVWQAEERARIEAYGVALAGGSAAGFALFSSYANRAPVCDALSPVWLSATVAGGGLLLVLSRLRLESRTKRLIAAVIAAAALAAAFALVWPQCLSQPEGASPELRRVWMNNVREVKPIWEQDLKVALGVVALPVAGVLGSLLLLWTRRRDAFAWPRAAGIALLSAGSLGLLFWGTRAAPGAQLLAVPGATALAWLLVPRLRAVRSPIVRILGPVLVIVIASGTLASALTRYIPDKAATPFSKQVALANRRCPALLSMKPLFAVPPGVVFTHVDLSPRLIALTRHSAIAGPYHRNGDAIVDVMHAFRGTEPQARAIVARHRADYLLICPNLSETTLYSTAAPRGFYVQLRDGRVPRWLTPVALPENSPFKMWRVVRESSPSTRRSRTAPPAPPG